MRLRVADYVARRLADWGVRDVFLVTGGGAMHLNDAFGQERRLRLVCNHHEQASAMAAEGYSRVSGRIGVISVTTGPGGINALNGVFGAWTDSIPMLVVSGQVKRETCLQSHPELTGLRQLGDQEAATLRLVEPITKCAAYVSEPEGIRFHLERAFHLATTGRPGPCWLDIPLDVQGAIIDENSLVGFDPSQEAPISHPADLARVCREIVTRLRGAQRPVIMLGNGLRISGTVEAARRIVERLGIPVVTSWGGIDLIRTDHPLFCGRPGTIGDRGGNFVVQNADLVLVLGSRLNLRQVSYNWRQFARHAFKIVVDIDPAELEKPLVKPDLPVNADLRDILSGVESLIDEWHPEAFQDWLAWCRERRQRHPVVTGQQRARHRDGCLNPYVFLEQVFSLLGGDDVVVCSNATPSVTGFQVARISDRMRVFANSGDASMGYDLPAAIGAAVAAGPERRVICLAGEGSIQMNIQELETVRRLGLPIKVVVLENGGYLSIRSTQQNFFSGRCTGESPASGVTFPDMCRIAGAYDLPTFEIRDLGYDAALGDFLRAPGPGVLVVHVDPAQSFEPKLGSRTLPDGRIVSPALEDMYPFLEREEFRLNMKVETPVD